MNRKYVLAAFAFLMLAAISICAQQPAAQPSPRPTGPQTSATIPDGKIAFIYSDDFRDAKTGIARYNVLMSSLAAEFAEKQREMNDLAGRMKQLQDEIARMQAGGVPVAPAQIQAKSDQYEQLKKDYQRKGEDGQALYKKRHDEVMEPLNQAIAKALDAYAKSHGISVLIDGSQVPVIYIADGIDITRPFINDFNSKNPVPAATPTRP